MGMRNWFKKSSKIFDKEGFYIVLFVCLCIVAVAAVFISRNNARIASEALKESNKTEYTEPENNKEVVDNSQNVEEAAPVVNTPVEEKKQNTEKEPSDNNKENSGSPTKETITKLEMPVEGQITNAFSKERPVACITLGTWETHEGIDIACDIGSDIKSAADGKVVEIRTEDNTVDSILKTGFGVSVIIEHEGGLRTVYSNLAEAATDEDGNVVSALKVKVGDSVKCGDVIGVAGDTSQREMVSIEGSHLHFQVLNMVNDQYVTVNPEDYLK